MKVFHRWLYIWSANLVFLLHIALGIFLLFGWWFPQIKYIYLVILIGWPLCWMILRYCPLSVWEFWLRKQYDPTIDIQSEVIQHYIYTFFGIRIPTTVIYTGGLIVFLILVILYFVRILYT